MAGGGQTEDVVPDHGWVQPSMAQLCLPGDTSPRCRRQHGGLGWHEHGGLSQSPLGCILPCWPWGRGGQEQVSAHVLRPSIWEFSCVPGEQTQGSSTLLTYHSHIQARFFWSCEVLQFTFEFHIAIGLPSRAFYPLSKSVSVTLQL